MIGSDRQWFSEREKVRLFAERVADRQVPAEFGGRVSIVLANLAERLNKRVSEPDWVAISRLYAAAFEIPDIRQTFPMLGKNYTTESYLKHLGVVCREAPWYAVFGICEACYQALAEEAVRRREYGDKEILDRLAYKAELTHWERDVNDLLTEFGLPWVFRNGDIKRYFPEPLDTVVEEAKGILANVSTFAGPNEEFTKALRHLRKSPEPDTANAVKDAVGALEGVARIMVNDPKAELDEALRKEPIKTSVHGALRESLAKIYAYKGDAPGAGHGQVSPNKPGIVEADFVVAVSAAAIVLLYNKYREAAAVKRES